MAAKRVIDAIYPNGVEGKRVVDLGCLEGGYSVEFARMGMDTLGIEVRRSNFENCLLVKAGLSLPNLFFVNDDAWNVANYGRFDIVFCAGLLYHMAEPDKFVSLLESVCNKALIIDTHFSTRGFNHTFRLGRLTRHEGMLGRWFREYNPTKANKVECLKWAAWSNHRSFWPLREHIPQMLRSAGFDLVFEQFDQLGDQIASSYAGQHRGIFVGVKTGRSGS